MNESMNELLIKLRAKITEAGRQQERQAVASLLDRHSVSPELRSLISGRAIGLVETVRADSAPSMMELFLGEYGLSSDEGVALMCLAEALLRVPDTETIDALIEDKIGPNDWDKHLNNSHSSLINASTWALFMTGKVLKEDKDGGVGNILRGAVKRLGEPVIRQAVTRVMKELGKQFVLGQTIDSAIKNAKVFEGKGFTYSYDMLGEAALTEADARRYYLSYSEAIGRIAKASSSSDIRKNPGISVKLSALHPRYETLQKDRVMAELLPRAKSLAVLAKSAGIGLNIDAEEAGRLDLSLDVIEGIVSDPALKGWDGFGVVVQAYGLRAAATIDWLNALALTYDRKLMVRLVKGAYWDTEIKHAQVEGHTNFPVFTRKASTDVSYICCAQKLLSMTERLYPQFATHNAHTVAAVLELAQQAKVDATHFEFQRLHGMGEALHSTVLAQQVTSCRIYAPVGAHKDLLAYLVRRLLENGANSSFVNQMVDESVSPAQVAADPFAEVSTCVDEPKHKNIKLPSELFAPSRRNSQGWDLEDPDTLATLQNGVEEFKSKEWVFANGSGEVVTVTNPATNPASGEAVGSVTFATSDEVEVAIKKLKPWTGISTAERANVLRQVADLYEANTFELTALLMREAGKTLLDCVGEIREAVDFLRFYADEAERTNPRPVGIFACVSPWNFPLAIFTGQISAALAAGNAVIAKPAESTSLIAAYAVGLMRRAGVPESTFQMLIGTGAEVGSSMVSNPLVSGVCFTGSTATAQRINRAMAKNLAPHAPLIAETGGLNAMIVDSTALPEQAVKDIVASAFQSAGQRCSALRVLYVQQDVAETFLSMLGGAMDELKVGDPWNFKTDVGPVIDTVAQEEINQHIDTARAEGRLIKQIDVPSQGTFVAPTLIKLSSILDLKEEVFGPVLHVVTYKQSAFGQVIKDINATGYGLTFGLHSRIDERVQYAIDHVDVGNIYINRNQIGAVVGSQPFGGEGNSGTGPKAGGAKYLSRFSAVEVVSAPANSGTSIGQQAIEVAFQKLETVRATSQQKVQPTELAGPTGESNLYSEQSRGRVLCLGPTPEQAIQQAEIATGLGCTVLAISPNIKPEFGISGCVEPEVLTQLDKLDAVVLWTDETRLHRVALADRDGAIVPLFSDRGFGQWLSKERHVCIDITAAGGNAVLLAG